MSHKEKLILTFMGLMLLIFNIGVLITGGHI